MKKYNDVLLALHSEDVPIYWRFRLTEKECEILKLEVEVYNDWIKVLFDGIAPLTSYADPADADQYYLAKRMIRTNHSYSDELNESGERFERPANKNFFEKTSYNFNVYIEGEPEYMDIADDPETGLGLELDIEPLSTLSDIIIGKLGEEFGLGYRILPFTSKLLNQ